jgi:preprotein translocase subunit SecA
MAGLLRPPPPALAARWPAPPAAGDAVPLGAETLPAGSSPDALAEAAAWLAALPPPPRARLPRGVQAALQAACTAAAALDDAALRQQAQALRRAAGRARQARTAARPLRVQALALAAQALQRHGAPPPYPTQWLAAWWLLHDQLLEMATGEGKTLAAALAACAAALLGERVHLLTANDYLAGRDHQALADAAALLGLRSACITAATALPERAALYRADLVVSTAREVAFDHLRDQLRARQRDPLAQPGAAAGLAGHAVHDERRLRAAAIDLPRGATAALAPTLPPLGLALVDEADHVLLDEAVVPLLLALPGQQADEAALQAALALVATLAPGADLRLDAATRSAHLTDRGAERAARACPPGHGGRAWAELVEQAAVATWLLQPGRDYLVHGSRLVLIDEATGRLAEGRQWSGPLHALVQLREGLAPDAATATAARTTYTGFFPRYAHLSGMSGTLAEARQELRLLYGRPLLRVPRAHPDALRWLGCRLLPDEAALHAAVLQAVQPPLRAGRPVLVAAASVAQARALAATLAAAGLAPQLLDASQTAQEADCVARAGGAGVLTVATQMAGRGTDIRLSDAARRAGGLHVVLAALQRSPRLQRQIVGRAGRQGDPGSAQALLSATDPLLRQALPAPCRRLPASIVLPWALRRLAARDHHRRRNLRLADAQQRLALALAGAPD